MKSISNLSFFTLSVVHFLATLYADGETTYVIEKDEKITNVIIDRKKYSLTQEALTTLKNVIGGKNIDITMLRKTMSMTFCNRKVSTVPVTLKIKMPVCWPRS